MKKTVTLLLAGMSLAHYSQTYNKLSEKTKHKIDSTFNALIKKYKVSGLSIGIVDRDGIVYSNGYGFSDVKNNVKATDKTIYRIGSMTKSFTALSIIQLQEKRLVNTDSSIRVYLPELRMQSRYNDNNQLYIKDILAHISGLPSDVSNGFFCDVPPDINWLIHELNKQVISFPSSYVHSYSNVGYGLMGEVIARKAKTSYSTYIKENIFRPLNMASSYIDKDSVLSANFSKAYIKNKEVQEPMIRDQAAGLIHSNAIDMSNYLRMYLNKGSLNGVKIVSEESINEMTKNRLENTELSSTKNWGFGLYTNQVYSKTNNDSLLVNIIGHGGDTYAFHSDMAFIPELGVGVVILTNSDKGAYINDADRLLKLYLEETSIKLNTRSKPKKKSPEGWSACGSSEIKGFYNAGDFIIQVKNTKKISFKQGPAKIIFKLKTGDSINYTAKARIYGIVPIKIKGQEFKFVKRNGQVYLKQVDIKSGNESFVVSKTARTEIPKTWSDAFGNYQIKKDYYTCTTCSFGNPEGSLLRLNEKDGIIVCKLKAKGSKTVSYINTISETTGVTGGVGRGYGETVKILDNGNIYYSGFEFEKK